MNSIDQSNIIIRRATKDDLHDIVTLLTKDDLGHNRELSPHNHQVDICYLNAFNLINQDTNHHLTVMEYANEIIGVAQIIIIPTITLKGCIRCEIEGVRIKDTYRNFGLGRMLFAWIKDYAISNRCGLIQLTTNLKRLDAKRFYESLGFVASHCGMKMDLSKE